MGCSEIKKLGKHLILATEIAGLRRGGVGGDTEFQREGSSPGGGGRVQFHVSAFESRGARPPARLGE